MEITLTDHSITVTRIGSTQVFLGEDIASVENVAGVGVNAPNNYIVLKDKFGAKLTEFTLFGGVKNQPHWTNDFAGVQRAIADISAIMGEPNCCAGGGGGGTVDTIVAGDAIDVDSTDPSNPIVGVRVDGVTVGINGSNQLEVPAGGGGYVPVSRQINTTSPITGGGNLSANRTIAIPAATSSVNGYLTSSDWSAFNAKGDVTGPGSSTTDNIALFADGTGKVIKDAGIDLSGVVTTDGNPAGVSPIGSGAGVSPIELRRFVDGTGTEAQANTGSVQYNLKFSAADKYYYGGALAAPTEGDITAAGRALLDDATAADQRTTLAAAPLYRTINAQSGTNYTLAATDAVSFITLSNAGAITLDIATNATVAITIGTTIPFKQTGAGQVTVTPAGGVTVQSFGNAYKLAGQYAEAVLTKIATDTWALEGNLVVL